MKSTGNMFGSPEYQKSKKTLLATMEGLEAIAKAPFFGSWVLDKEKKIVLIAEQISKLLFGLTSTECQGYTYKELFEMTCKDKTQCETVDTLRDIMETIEKYVLDNFNTSTNLYENFQFFVCFDHPDGAKHFWKIIKYIEPFDSKKDGWKHIVSHALFLNVLDGGYEKSLIQLASMKRRKVIKRISDIHPIYVSTT